MLCTILITLAVIIVALVGYASTRPDDFRVSRNITILAPPEAIFEYVNDLSKWHDWSPWAKIDPNAKTSFDGVTSGKGAVFHWDGNRNLGAGSMAITDSKPNEFVKLRLDFLRPFKGTSTADFTFQARGNQTMVTWSMQCTNDKLIAKIFGLLMNCDAMISKQYDKGLAQLKAIAEKK